jgi:solute carrier family 25 (adenine nucleotide translocator) protein 4/5/6/31
MCRFSVQVGRQHKTFNGLWDCLVKTAETPAGLYRLYNGFGISVIGIIPYRGVYFGMYDSLAGINPLKDHKGMAGIMSKFAIAQTTAITAGYASYPFDTIRRRLQMQSEKPRAEWIYSGAADCYKKILKDEGVRALFKGAGANVIRTIGSALVLVLYDEVKSWRHYLR